MKTPCASALAAVASICAACAAGPEDSCVAALRRALGSGAEWTMERRLEGSSRPLVSSGTVDCFAGSGIVWRVAHPFPSSVEMTADKMVFEDEDGRRIKPLGEMKHYAEIRERTDAFAGGDRTAFDGLFRLDAKETDEGRGWTVSLIPEVKAMQRLISGIELSGGATLTNAVLRTGDGGVSVIRFKETSRAH